MKFFFFVVISVAVTFGYYFALDHVGQLPQPLRIYMEHLWFVVFYVVPCMIAFGIWYGLGLRHQEMFAGTGLLNFIIPVISFLLNIYFSCAILHEKCILW